MAQKLGIQSPLDDYFAIGLGAEAVNPLEIARAFATIANNGARVDGRITGDRARAIVEVKNAPGRDENSPVRKQVLDPDKAQLVTSFLEQVVRRGTGKRAWLPRYAVAGKTGTTENYGDAWFVGYTPDLVVAVWVGYPTTLKAMLDEFNGSAVAGGTYPALIWKSFMESALPYLGIEPRPFAEPLVPSASPKRVVHRNGRWGLDNGYCKESRTVLYFAGEGPTRTAACKPNEVEVPRVVGTTLAEARARLAAQPLTPELIFKPAVPGQRLGVVLDQWPRRGLLSSFDRVRLVLARPLHGRVPDVVGLRLREARAKLTSRRLRVVVTASPLGKRGRVQAQDPPGGVAAAPRMEVRLVVAR
jgi:membrane peptidoglycan carboxypeptidase